MNVNIPELLQKVKDFSSEMTNIRTGLSNITVTGESGAGFVSVEMNGEHKLISINIADEIYQSGDKKMVEDLIIAAINNAVAKVDEKTKEEMSKISTMLPNIPGINLNIK